MTFGLSLLVVVWVVRMNCCGRFGFCGSIMLVVSCGDQVSFYTTVHGDVGVSFKRTTRKQSNQLTDRYELNASLS